MDPALRRAAPETIGWSGWLRRPVVSMSLGFAALILAIGFFSNRPTTVAPSASLQLTAGRGVGSGAVPSAVPARQFDLTLADGPHEGGPFRIEVVNAMGVSMWSGLALGDPSGIHVDVTQQLLPGDYFVRLPAADGKVLREYPFRVR
jgi:hypothetical protein